MLTSINLDQLKALAQTTPEIKRLCKPNIPLYLLQMELERYNCTLNTSYYDLFKKSRKSIFTGRTK